MPLNFPTSPSLNQIFTSGQRSWQWTGEGWNVVLSDSTPTFSIGSVTSGPSPAVTITGTSPNFVLNFQLQSAGDVSTSSTYADPSWITSLSASKVGLGNVTNESKATMFTDPTFTGTTTLQQSTEVIETKTSATGVVTHDFSTTAIWYHSNLSDNFTANLINLPTTDNRSISVSLVLAQGATARVPTALQIDGVSQTINWASGTLPTGNNNKIDLVSFTLIRSSSSWTVIGNLSSFG